MSETDSFIIPTKLKYTLPSSSTITVNNTDNTNNVINYSNSKKMKPFIVRDNADKTAEFGQITNDIQNLIADTQKDIHRYIVKLQGAMLVKVLAFWIVLEKLGPD